MEDFDLVARRSTKRDQLSREAWLERALQGLRTEGISEVCGDDRSLRAQWEKLITAHRQLREERQLLYPEWK